MMNEVTTPTTSSSSMVRWFAPLWDPATWKRTAYLLAAFPLGQLSFVFTVTMVAAGLGLVIVWVGVIVLAAAFAGWRLGAGIERLRAAWFADVEIPTPYRPTPPDARLLDRAKLWLSDPATWRDLAYLLLLFPLGILWLVLVLVVWLVPGSLLSAPFVYPWVDATIRVANITIDNLPEALVAAAVGIALLPMAARIMRVAGDGHALLAKALLGPNAAATAHAEVETLRISRNRGLDAAVAERRRIERDLHDGAQQRLVAVAMQLGQLREKLDDEDETRALVEEAHDEAKRALAELRDLARGIHPAILSDRGLDAALSALAARAEIPVEVRCDLDHRPKSSIESTAYFVAAEALTNVGKHASAGRATVTVSCDGATLVVVVSDNGVGGAVATGPGLTGLADRVAAVGGDLQVVAAAGAGTTVRAELPCES